MGTARPRLAGVPDACRRCERYGRGFVRGGAAPRVQTVGVWSMSSLRWAETGGKVRGRRRGAGSLGWGLGAEGSTAAPAVQSLKAVEWA